MRKNKVIAVIGPTASGKTSMAIELARKFDGELINTDSRQIYKYLDIGTAKGEVRKIKDLKVRISKVEGFADDKLDVYDIEGAIIHLINVLKPDEVLTLAQYQSIAYKVIENILKRGKLPILVGGTGLYIDSIVKGYKIPKVKPDKILRKNLKKYSISKLIELLRSLNENLYRKLNNSDRSNKHRLIRLIEIEKLGENIKRFEKIGCKYEVLFLTPKRTREELYERINKRAKIILDSGLVDEVRGLISKGYKFDTPAFTSISYPIVKEYIEGKIDREELMERFKQGDRNYARRQITWFKRYNAKEVNEDEALSQVKKFLKSTS